MLYFVTNNLWLSVQYSAESVFLLFQFTITRLLITICSALIGERSIIIAYNSPKSEANYWSQARNAAGNGPTYFACQQTATAGAHIIYICMRLCTHIVFRNRAYTHVFLFMRCGVLHHFYTHSTGRTKAEAVMCAIFEPIASSNASNLGELTRACGQPARTQTRPQPHRHTHVLKR